MLIYFLYTTLAFAAIVLIAFLIASSKAKEYDEYQQRMQEADSCLWRSRKAKKDSFKEVKIVELHKYNSIVRSKDGELHSVGRDELYPLNF